MQAGKYYVLITVQFILGREIAFRSRGYTYSLSKKQSREVVVEEIMNKVRETGEGERALPPDCPMVIIFLSIEPD